jgi:hypothetical protein
LPFLLDDDRRKVVLAMGVERCTRPRPLCIFVAIEMTQGSVVEACCGVEIGKAMGARVIAAAGGVKKLAVARSRGADELIDYKEESIRDRVRALTGGKGADVVYDPVGGDAFDQALRAVNWKARDAGDRLCRWPYPGGPGQSDPGQEHLGHRRRLGRTGRTRPCPHQSQCRQL